SSRALEAFKKAAFSDQGLSRNPAPVTTRSGLGVDELQPFPVFPSSCPGSSSGTTPFSFLSFLFLHEHQPQFGQIPQRRSSAPSKLSACPSHPLPAVANSQRASRSRASS